MRIRRVGGALLIVALTTGSEMVGVARAGDDIADSVAGVILDDGPEIAGKDMQTPKRAKHRNRRAIPAPAATPIWEQDGPPIDRGSVDGR